MFANTSSISYDPELAASMEAEAKRQKDHVELIASENYTSPRVMEAQGSVLTNKYAEGYQVSVTTVVASMWTSLKIWRLSELSNCSVTDYANVQPHAGSQANAAVFLALLNAGDTVLGMSLNAGGHLTHGSHVNFSGKSYKAVQYGIDEQGYVDYDEIRALARAPAEDDYRRFQCVLAGIGLC